MKFIFLLIVSLLVSCQSAKLGDAREHYARGEYHAAAEIYRELYRGAARDQRAMRGVIAYEMAENYRQLNQATRAAGAYRNAIRYEYPDTLMYFHYARMLHQEGEHEQAAAAYQDFLAMQPGHPRALSGLHGTELAIKGRETPTRYAVKQEEVFFSNRGEFSPMLNRRGDQLYFTSSRETSRGEEQSPVTGMKYNDIYFSETNVHGEWQQPKRMETSVNTGFDEGTPAFSPDGEWMYYTYSYADPNRGTTPEIHVSRNANGEWSGGRALEFPGDSLWIFAHPAPSPCGNYLYFVSDMPGGQGGKDIWRAKLKGSTEILSIENMGPEINSPGDEMFPYARNDSTLYFSSDGHPGMGGLDLFIAVASRETDRWQVRNMQPPLNSPADDFGITFYPQDEKGFFSSNRDDARGYDHIYSFEYAEPSIRVEGIAVDHQDVLIPGVAVAVVGSNGARHHFITNGDGEYGFKAKAGVEYLFLASMEGFLNLKGELQAFPANKDTLVYVDFEMIPIGKPVVMEHIYYDFDSAVLRPESAEELEELVSLMGEHPEIFVELSAHTDRTGPDDYNRDLSLQRARSVVDYLVARGIEKERLTAAGHGKSRPEIVGKRLASKYDFLKEGDVLSAGFIKQLTEEQQEIADQINRRTSFKVGGSNAGLHGR